MTVEYLVGHPWDYQVMVRAQQVGVGQKTRYIVELTGRDSLLIQRECWLLWTGAMRVAREMMDMIEASKEPYRRKRGEKDNDRTMGGADRS